MFVFLNRIPDKLKRITSGTELIPEIDGLRFIAIFTVLIQHLYERFIRHTLIQFNTPTEDNPLTVVATKGIVGVYVFFIISGFILALPFASKILAGKGELKLKNYYIRRLTRLEPPYFIWMTVLFLGFTLSRQINILEYLPHLLANLTYTHALFYHGWSPINPPTWTLEVEVQFYILAPFLAIAFFQIKNKVARRICMILFIILFMVIQQYFEFFRFPWYLTILGYLHYFLIGFILTDIYLCEWRGKIIKGNSFYDFVAIVSFTLVIVIFNWEFFFFDRIAVLLLLFIFFYSVFKGNYVNKFFTNRWIMVTGGMCYTIYLIHLPIAEVLMTITKNIEITKSIEINFLIQLLIFLPVIFVISSVGFLLFEKPFMNKDWPKNLKKKLISILPTR